MWSAGIILLFATWWVTQNIVFASCIAGGYYVVALALGFVLRRVCRQTWICVSMQILIAACLFVGLFCIGYSSAKKADRSSLREQITSSDHSKDDKVRDFALREVPSVWKTYQVLNEAIEEQDKKIAELRTTLKMFGSNVDEDLDIRNLLQTRDEMTASRDAIKAKLEDAYLQTRKFATTPDRSEFDQLRKQVVEDSINEAQSALQRYKAMKEKK